jgi:hypothetical protein
LNPDCLHLLYFYNTTTITREQALCTSFLKEYTEENAKEAEKELQEIGGGKFDLCYLTDPMIPVLVVKQRIYGAPSIFKQYTSGDTKEDHGSSLDNRTLLGRKQ